MTKKFVFLSGLLLLAAWARGQTLVGSAGATITGSGLIFEFAVGEAAIATIQAGGSSPVTQGLLQPLKIAPYVITDTDDPFDARFGFRYYPNPSPETISIETSYPGFETFRVLGIDGQAVEQGPFDYSPIQVYRWPSGIYVVQLFSKDQTITKSFKIIKS